MAATAPKDKSYFPLSGVANDGWSNETEATSTCLCGAVQVVTPIAGPDFLGGFLCNCTDCRKKTASMFATNYTVTSSSLRYARGEDNLTVYSQKHSIGSGGYMADSFCKTCGTLMWRAGSKFPGVLFMRVGTVDDFTLHETVLRPKVEQFTKDRVSWFHGVVGAENSEGLFSTPTG